MAFEKRIPAQGLERLTLVTMAGNLALDTWDEFDILIRGKDGGEEALTIEQTDAGLALSCNVSCEITLPGALPVTVRQAHGNLRVDAVADLNAEQVRGNLKMGGVDQAVVAEVHGNLKADTMTSLRLVGTVYGGASLASVEAIDLQNVRGNLQAKASGRLRASRVNGNFSAKEIGGPVSADQVGGNALLKDVQGPLALDQVAGNLVAKQLAGGARVPRIGGNLTLNGELVSGCTYHFKTGGDAVVRIPEGTGVHVTAIARGRIVSSWDLEDQEQVEGRLTGTLAGGGAELAIEAGGNLVLGGGPEVIGTDVGDEISRQIEASLQAIDLEAISRQVGHDLESALSRLRVKMEGVNWDQMGLQAQQAVERAMERIERDMERVMAKAARQQERLEKRLEREARRMERAAERHEHHKARHDPSPEVEVEFEEESAAQGQAEADLEEQRLSILRMVEHGQITPEEAEMLLDALE
ncbi:MAG: hypothetical protein PVJ34_08715 [Anaerolineae bacterium]|jgi:hypothetical protein